MKKQLTTLQLFRKVSVAEGISFLILIGVAMPLKYFVDAPEMVRYTGWVHGVLFIAYLVVGLQTALLCKWQIGKVAMAVLASLLPLGPFVFEKKLKEEELLLREELKRVS